MFVTQGKTVGVICATAGEKGVDRMNLGRSPKELAEIRAEELHAACQLMGCECKKIFQYPDGGLSEENFTSLVQDLTEQVNLYKPEVVLTFGSEGITGHRDHILIGQAAMEASKRAEFNPSEIWLAGMPRSVIKNFQEHMNQRKVHHSHFEKNILEGMPDEKLKMIDLEKFAELKHQAIKTHASQYTPSLVANEFLKNEGYEIIKLP